MKIDIARIRSHIEALAAFTATPGKGTTRLSYSPEYRQGCDYLEKQAERLGLSARLDAVGNLRIRLPGRDPDAPVVLVGSHIDSVSHGGNFDGVLGVVCGLEALETMVRVDARPAHPIELISFIEEEGVSFGCPLAGSQALAGELTTDDLHSLCNQAGDSMHALATRFGCRPDNLPADRLRSGAVKAMLELHIEQAPVLEAEGLAVGVVEGIAGSENHRIRLFGTANHAGTTPMAQRRDALAAAAEIVLAVEQLVLGAGRSTTVATIGRIDCLPNAANVIPGFVELSLDVRDASRENIDTAVADILDAARAVTARRGIKVEFVRTGHSAPRPLAPNIIERVAMLADAAGTPYRRMYSGALHDAATLTDLTDVGMIFVPSCGGLSHTPEEWTDYADIEPGANLLLATLQDLAVMDDPARI